MIDAIDSDIVIHSSNTFKLEDCRSEKVCELALQIITQITQHTNDLGRVFNAFSYLVTKIEDFQILEKFVLAFDHKNTQQLKELILQINHRPESIIMKSVVCEYFEKALRNNENEIAEFMWKELEGQLAQTDVSEILELAIVNENIDRVKWLLENFDIKMAWNANEIIYEAVEHDMFFVLETLIEKCGDFDIYDMKWAFERIINNQGDHFLNAAMFFWPKVKDEIAEDILTDAIRNATKKGNLPMITFLKECVKEKR